MNSCFPHLAILNPRNANKSRDRLNDERNVVNTEDIRMRSRTPTLSGKNDIFQDLDLYYVRQIARNSKVRSRLMLLLMFDDSENSLLIVSLRMRDIVSLKMWRNAPFVFEPHELFNRRLLQITSTKLRVT